MRGFLRILKIYGPPALLLCVALAIALVKGWRVCVWASGLRGLVAFVAAGLVIYGAHRGLISRRRVDSSGTIPAAEAAATTADPMSVRFVIAFDSIVFTVVGVATAVAAAPQWETALLLFGTCLLIGAFFGLLFGYPQGVAQRATQQPTPQSDQSGQVVSQDSPQKNLIAESASTLGKVIAGFTLAKATPLIHHFHQICDTVGPALGQQPSHDAGFVLAGTIILYSFATGFFSGLLLPSYFMSGRFG